MQLNTLLVELRKLLELPDEDGLKTDTRLDGFDNWDSLTKVTLIGVISDLSGVTLDGSALDEVHTPQEIAALIEATAATGAA